ncbi:uncharacterized protein CYBJADRAFT_166667, partial [Cyberlindnera jadinii NRRL Y-1542]
KLDKREVFLAVFLPHWSLLPFDKIVLYCASAFFYYNENDKMGRKRDKQTHSL